MKPRHDDVPLEVGAYTVDEIVAANRRHDRVYGWSPLFPMTYSNRRRMPESVWGEPWVSRCVGESGGVM